MVRRDRATHTIPLICLRIGPRLSIEAERPVTRWKPTAAVWKASAPCECGPGPVHRLAHGALVVAAQHGEADLAFLGVEVGRAEHGAGGVDAVLFRADARHGDDRLVVGDQFAAASRAGSWPMEISRASMSCGRRWQWYWKPPSVAFLRRTDGPMVEALADAP